MGITLEEGFGEGDVLPGKASSEEIDKFEKLIEGVDLSGAEKDE
jgi:hypothetical protein